MLAHACNKAHTHNEHACLQMDACTSDKAHSHSMTCAVIETMQVLGDAEGRGTVAVRKVEMMVRHATRLLESLAAAAPVGGIATGTQGCASAGGCASGGEARGLGGMLPVKVMRVCLESRHNCVPNTHLAVSVTVPEANGLRLSLDSRCHCKTAGGDGLTLYTDALLQCVIGKFGGPSGSGNWASPGVCVCS